jgi:predicted helicase
MKYSDSNETCDASISLNISDRVSERFHMALTKENKGRFKAEASRHEPPKAIFNYLYAILHSSIYRRKYAEFLKTDFPRIPFTKDRELFTALAKLGAELIELHLLTAPLLNKPMTNYVGAPAPLVEKVIWADETVWLDKARTAGFIGVPENVWNYYIGGYQVCAKWLKDRKGRTLSHDDLAHYQKIVVALHETIHLQAEIDKLYPRVEETLASLSLEAAK